MYLSRYLCGVILGFLLSFYGNSSSFVFNHLLISSFVGFHSMIIPFLHLHYLHDLLWIPFTQSHVVPAGNGTICWLLISRTTYWADPDSYLNRFPTKPYKTIGPYGKPKGNTTHIRYCAVSSKIVLWVTAMLSILYSRREWGYGILIDILQALN
jgi:hypothetical protein